jgi:hypothetical protein
VNHALSGTFVIAADKYILSKVIIVMAGKTTTYQGRSQTMRATRVTINVSKKVTMITQTPYALPRDIVLLYTAVTITVLIIRSQLASGT